MIPQLSTIAIAGTFDHLHKGHRYFISEAFKYGEKVLIGLTSDEFVEQKLKAQSSKLKTKVNNYKDRKKELEEFLKEKGLWQRAEITMIDDVYGPSIANNRIEALVVTVETLDGAAKVNKKREELKLSPLKIITIPLILAEDKERIASMRIRLGEIDRWGRLYISKIKNQKSKIDEGLRQELKKPLGLLIEGNPDKLSDAAEELKKLVAKTNFTMLSTVGDEVTRICNEVGIAINLAIIDFKVNRVEKYRSLSELGIRNYEGGITRVSNPSGHITNELVDAVKNAYTGIVKDGKQRIIQVDGEEDLTGVPAVLLAPLGALVLYGQPGEGVVAVEVTEEKKEELLTLIKKNI